MLELLSNCLQKFRHGERKLSYTGREHGEWICLRCIENILPFNHFDDDGEFLSALAEYWQTKLLLPFDVLKNDNRVFMPLDLNSDKTSPLSDVDPDIQFYQNQQSINLLSCDYHLEESFN